MEHLTAAAWPKLKSLVLETNPLTAIGLAKLSTGNWPELQELSLRHVFYSKTQTRDGCTTPVPQEGRQLEPAFLKPFTIARWPELEMLDVSGCYLNAANLAWLIECQWSCLTVLGLSGQTLCPASFAIISQGKWPSLERLQLCNTGIDSESMSYLVLAKWPKLKYLDLSMNAPTLDGAALTVFAKNRWSCLEKISLHENNMDLTCITEIVKGDWPILKFLDVSSSELDAVAVSKLRSGKWPFLECLELADNEFTEGVMHLLSPGNQAGLDVGENIVSDPIDILEGHWPHIQAIIFSCPEEHSMYICDWRETCTCCRQHV